MFTIKIQSDNHHSMIEAQSYTAMRHKNGDVSLFVSTGECCDREIVLHETTAFVMNAEGKTVDVIRPECSEEDVQKKVA